MTMNFHSLAFGKTEMVRVADIRPSNTRIHYFYTNYTIATGVLVYIAWSQGTFSISDKTSYREIS